MTLPDSLENRSTGSILSKYHNRLQIILSLYNEIEPLRQISLDSYPTIWVVRAGEKGKEKDALDNNLVTIAWNGLENLSKITNRGELEDIYIKAYENERNKRNYSLV